MSQIEILTISSEVRFYHEQHGDSHHSTGKWKFCDEPRKESHHITGTGGHFMSHMGIFTIPSELEAIS